jgi:phosphohistidine phosphatase SixA
MMPRLLVVPFLVVMVAIGTLVGLAACQREPAANQVTAEATPAMLAAVSPTASSSAGPCQFVPRLAEMRNQIGAAIVGDCIESEHQVPGTDNSEQRTTNGVFSHRDIDNRDLFLSASQTWIDSPKGLVTRPINQRFEWEGDRQMVEALRAGGYVIYFRHGATDQTQTDSDPNNLANCATQRSLTGAGRSQAQIIGDSFRSLAIPVGTVLSSEYCRALEYSRIAFTAAQPERSLDLTDPLTDPQKAESAQTVKGLLGTLPTARTNTVLVSHSPNIRLAVGVELPVEGEAAIFRVEASGTSTLVTRVLPTDWPILAQALTPPAY